VSVLDKIAAWLDRREVLALREKAQAAASTIGEQQETIREQIEKISSANLRLSQTTNANLELKRIMRAHGIDTDGMPV
jgi:hypothetical protein